MFSGCLSNDINSDLQNQNESTLFSELTNGKFIELSSVQCETGNISGTPDIMRDIYSRIRFREGYLSSCQGENISTNMSYYLPFPLENTNNVKFIALNSNTLIGMWNHQPVFFNFTENASTDEKNEIHSDANYIKTFNVSINALNGEQKYSFQWQGYSPWNAPLSLSVYNCENENSIVDAGLSNTVHFLSGELFELDNNTAWSSIISSTGNLQSFMTISNSSQFNFLQSDNGCQSSPLINPKTSPLKIKFNSLTNDNWQNHSVYCPTDCSEKYYYFEDGEIREKDMSQDGLDFAIIRKTDDSVQYLTQQRPNNQHLYSYFENDNLIYNLSYDLHSTVYNYGAINSPILIQVRGFEKFHNVSVANDEIYDFDSQTKVLFIYKVENKLNLISSENDVGETIFYLHGEIYAFSNDENSDGNRTLTWYRFEPL
jgi:hypothetical protein